MVAHATPIVTTLVCFLCPSHNHKLLDLFYDLVHWTVEEFKCPVLESLMSLTSFLSVSLLFLKRLVEILWFIVVMKEN